MSPRSAWARIAGVERSEATTPRKRSPRFVIAQEGESEHRTRAHRRRWIEDRLPQGR
jgi:hypothetical protein